MDSKLKNVHTLSRFTQVSRIAKYIKNITEQRSKTRTEFEKRF